MYKKCEECSKYFIIYASTINRRFCSKGCRNGRRGPSKEKTGKICICKTCGKEIYIFLSGFKKGSGKFCSIKCKKMTDEQKNYHISILKKVAESRKTRVTKQCETCSKDFEVQPYLIKKGYGRFCSIQCRKLPYEEIAKKLSIANVGRVPWNKGLTKYDDSRIGKPNKGQFINYGKTEQAGIERSSSRMRQWRRMVFERDNFTCQMCFTRGGKLNADHIKPFSQFSELRYELSNGRTLCVGCHRKTPTYSTGAKKFNKNYYGDSSLNFS